jgi:surface polysaccharide O-acyltransferase-like enzyme
MPFYRVIAKHCRDRELKYLIVVYVVFISLLPLLQIIRWNSGFYLATNLIYPGYLFLGYMIHQRKLNLERSIAWALVIGCSVLIVMLTVLRYNYGENIFGSDILTVFDKNLFGYHSILVIGQAAGIFALLNKVPVKKNGPVITLLDQCGFGAYLIHMIFIHIVLKHMNVDPYEYGGAIIFLAMTIVFYIAAVGITWLLRLIPGARQIL